MSGGWLWSPLGAASGMDGKFFPVTDLCYPRVGYVHLRSPPKLRSHGALSHPTLESRRPAASPDHSPVSGPPAISLYWKLPPCSPPELRHPFLAACPGCLSCSSQYFLSPIRGPGGLLGLLGAGNRRPCLSLCSWPCSQKREASLPAGRPRPTSPRPWGQVCPHSCPRSPPFQPALAPRAGGLGALPSPGPCASPVSSGSPRPQLLSCWGPSTAPLRGPPAPGRTGGGTCE